MIVFDINSTTNQIPQDELARIKRIEELSEKIKKGFAWELPCLTVQMEAGTFVISNKNDIRAVAEKTIKELHELVDLLNK